MKIEEAKRHSVEAIGHRDDAESARSASKAIRNAAKGTDDVLSSLIPQGPLRVEDGRLVVSSDRSESELFAELSDGERWTIAIDLAANQLDADGLLVIPQPAYEGLTESIREMINSHAKERKVTIITAEAVDGPLEVATR